VFSLICAPLQVKVGPAAFWPGIDKNSPWDEMNIQKGELRVKEF
jgi:hypothetical protein